MLVFGYALGLLIGISLGLIGGGGSILTVPIFVYVFGIEAKSAIAMSLAVVGLTSLVGAVQHWRAGNVNIRVALIFGSVAMVGTWLGARLAVFFTGAAQLTLFAAVMLLSAWFMLKPSKDAAQQEGSEGDANPALASTGMAELKLPLIIVEGLAVGILTGLVGVGGGFLVVPALVLLGKVPMKQAIGTSLLVIALKSASGFAGYLGTVPVDWSFMGSFAVLAVAGIFIGTALVKHVSGALLKKIFATFLLVMGAFILYQNRAVFLGG